MLLMNDTATLDKVLRYATLVGAAVLLLALLLDPRSWLGSSPGRSDIGLYLLLGIGPAVLAGILGLRGASWALVPIGVWFLIMGVWARYAEEFESYNTLLVVVGLWFMVAPVWRRATRK